MRLKPENGTAIVVPIKVTVVSSELTSLTIDVVDAYTLGADDGNGPHVGGATVRLPNSLTHEVVMTGTTGSEVSSPPLQPIRTAAREIIK